jgi:hypothetical protein
MRAEILFAGIGWIAAGVVSLSGWWLETGGGFCQCSNPSNLFYTGTLVIAVGLALLLLNKKIEKIRERMVRKQRKGI